MSRPSNCNQPQAVRPSDIEAELDRAFVLGCFLAALVYLWVLVTFTG